MLLRGPHVAPLVTLFFSLTQVTCMALHHTAQWSSGAAPVLLKGHYATPVVTWWSTRSATDLREHFWLSGIFYSAIFPVFFFQGFPGASNSTAKLAGFHTDLRNIAPAQLFVWRVLCHTFYLRARTGQSQTLIFKELLCYGNFIFERFTSYGIWTLSAIGENLTSLLS